MKRKLTEVDQFFIKGNLNLTSKELAKKTEVSEKVVQKFVETLKSVVTVVEAAPQVPKIERLKPQYISKSNGGRDGITIATEQTSEFNDAVASNRTNPKYSGCITKAQRD